MTAEMSASSLGRWQPLAPAEIAALMERCSAAWWIAGGYAIDAFIGRFDRRHHDDVDVGVLARDQSEIRRSLPDWDFQCADPPGRLRPWLRDERLDEPVHDVWVREHSDGRWRLQLVLNPSRGEHWVYRRDGRVSRPLDKLVFESDGIAFLAPEVQLLFKSKTLRRKDEQDFDDALPLLDDAQRRWLRSSLEVAHPGHPWMSRL